MIYPTSPFYREGNFEEVAVDPIGEFDVVFWHGLAAFFSFSIILLFTKRVSSTH